MCKKINLEDFVQDTKTITPLTPKLWTFCRLLTKSIYDCFKTVYSRTFDKNDNSANIVTFRKNPILVGGVGDTKQQVDYYDYYDAVVEM